MFLVLRPQNCVSTRRLQLGQYLKLVHIPNNQICHQQHSAEPVNGINVRISTRTNAIIARETQTTYLWVGTCPDMRGEAVPKTFQCLSLAITHGIKRINPFPQGSRQPKQSTPNIAQPIPLQPAIGLAGQRHLHPTHHQSRLQITLTK